MMNLKSIVCQPPTLPAPMPAPMPVERRPMARPVLVLDVDKDGARARQRELVEYGIAWIVIVHTVADARRFLEIEPTTAVVLTLRNVVPDAVDLAHALHAASHPCLLLVVPHELAHITAQAALPTAISLDCQREILFRALDRLDLRHIDS